MKVRKILKRMLAFLLCVEIAFLSSKAPEALASQMGKQIQQTTIPGGVRKQLEEMGIDVDELIEQSNQPPQTYITEAPEDKEHSNIDQNSGENKKEPVFNDPQGAREQVDEYNPSVADEIFIDEVKNAVQNGTLFVVGEIPNVVSGKQSFIDKFITPFIGKQDTRQLARYQELIDKIAKKRELIQSGNLTEKEIARINKYIKGKSDDLARAVSKTSKVSKVSRICNGISIVSSAYWFVSDMSDLVHYDTGGIYNEKPGLRQAETLLVGADAMINLAGIVLTIAGVSVGWEFIVAGLAVSVLVSLIHDEDFAGAANNADSFSEFLKNLLSSNRKTPSGVGAYKPNIYFYNAKGKKLRVKMEYESLITKSIPAYQEGWQVKITDDLSKMQTVDGKEYDFLFYESVTDRRLFQTEKGILIPANNRADTFATILKTYGFNEVEITDFIEYWDHKLEREIDYVMYPQDTAIVDLAMPINIQPQPEQIVRIWFAFEQEKGQTYEKEEIIPFSHNGYTVVEWGGMIF